MEAEELIDQGIVVFQQPEERPLRFYAFADPHFNQILVGLIEVVLDPTHDVRLKIEDDL
jgi:hypothetical protein